eukprot:8958228-Pyramimonas_sp.AAC.2
MGPVGPGNPTPHIHQLPKFKVTIAVSPGSGSLGESGPGLRTGQCLASFLANRVAPGKFSRGQVGVRTLAKDVLASH